MPAYLQYPEWLSPVVIPGLPIRWYGLMYLVAFTVAYLLLRYQLREQKIEVDQDTVLNLFFWGIIGLLLGARVFAALVYDPSGRYLTAPWLIFWPFDSQGEFTGLQGMSYHGGLLGAVIAGVLYLKRHKLSVLEWGDMIVAGIPLGFMFGRIGNFINGELYGRVTTSAIGMMFPHARRLDTRNPWVAEIAEAHGIEYTAGELINLPRHPSQLYQAFLEGFALWAILWFFVRKRKPFHGFVLASYLIGYGVLRFIAEYFREPDEGLEFPIQLSSLPNPPELFVSPLNITTGQILSSLMVIAGALMLAVLWYRRQNAPKVQTFEAVPPSKPKRKRRKGKRHK